MTARTKLTAGGSTAGLSADLERDLRAAINPLYEDVPGTESYERKRLLGEIDSLREIEKAARSLLKKCDDEGLLLGGGRNHPGEKEGPSTRRLRKALEGAARPTRDGRAN